MGGTNDNEEARKRDIERIKAEARAFALSDMTRKKERERAKFVNLPASMVTGRARRRPPPPPYPPQGAPFHDDPHNGDQQQSYPPHQQPPYPPPYGYPYQHPYPYPPYHPQYPPAHEGEHSQQQQSADETVDLSPPMLSPNDKDPSIQRTMQSDGIVASQHPAPSRPAFTPHAWNFDEYDEEYGRFVKSLWDDALFVNDEEEDADEFHLEKEDDEEDENDDDKEDENVEANEVSHEDSSPPGASDKPKKGLSTDTSPLDPDLFQLGEKYYQELEEELGWLEEEDMEAAVTTLLDPPKTPLTSNTSSGSIAKPENWSSPAPSVSTQKQSPRSQSTPFREAARATHVTETQYKRLQHLLQSHYQLLLQQTVLAARAAPTQSKATESAADLMQIVNHATGMLQDIDQHRRNAILSKVQQGAPQRLTRLQFSKTLQEDQTLETVFDVDGLKQLKETFDWIDKSVEVLKAKSQGPPPPVLNQDGTTTMATVKIEDDSTMKEEVENESTTKDKSDDSIDRILPTDTNSEACQKVFKHVGASFNADILPAARDLSGLFADAEEALGANFVAPCTPEQNAILRRNRNLFTFGEDNLVLQGVNLYGEKQWILLADRLLPDRSVNIISQRYAKLCVMLYRANGVIIDEEGNLENPPKYDNVDDVNAAQALTLRRVEAPAVLNVHRWSLQEDITTLKAVPIYGTMWAEISSRLLPHRDRGHIRKRYLVLQRRIKAAVSRERGSQRPRPLTYGVESAPPQSRNMTHAAVSRNKVGEPATSANPVETNRPGRYDPVYAAPPVKAQVAPHRPRTPARDLSTKKSPFVVTKSPPFHVIGKSAPSYEPPALNHEDSSRAAFEKLVQDAGSRVAFERLAGEQGDVAKHSVESDSESNLATNLVTKLSDAYPPGYMENDDSNSQFSMLDSYRLGMSRDAPQYSKSPRKSAVHEAIDENNLPITMPPPSKVPAQGSIFESPKKAKKGGAQETPTRTAVRLPANTPTAQSFCEFGSMLSPVLKHLASPSLTLHTFPETSNLIKDGDFIMDSNGGQSHIFGVPQTPTSAKSSTSSGSGHRNKNSNFWGDHSTLMENDLEAISALNSLSSSPATGTGSETASPSKSLFAKVIGHSRNTVQPSTKKRKLQF